MTGPEHYREAEDLLNQPWQGETHATLFIAQAQVHATLALAAGPRVIVGYRVGDRLYAPEDVLTIYRDPS